MTDAAHKLRFREKAGYSLGDASANFVFQTLLIFQSYFYTDVFGISASAAAWLFLLVRFSDAITDPIMGIIADRTETRWGKFRPWILWSAIPFCLMFWLAFTTPDWGDTAKLFYAYITYIVLMMMYTVNNVPYSALNGVMTADVDERTSLSQFRFFAAMAAALLVQGLVRPLADKFGQGDNQLGWSITMGIFAAVALVFFVITFFTTKERVRPPKEQKNSIAADFNDAFTNRPWLTLFFATLMIFTMLSFRGGSYSYFFDYYLSQPALADFARGLGLGAPEGPLNIGQQILNAFGLLIRDDNSNAVSVGFGFFNMAGSFITILGVLMSKKLSEWFGKRRVFTVSLAATAVAGILPFFLPAEQVTLHFLVGMLWSLCYGPSIPLLWSMIGDAADYSEWRNHRRSTAFVFAGVVFALKAGLGIGGFLGGQVLAAYGYAAGVAQTETSLLGIRLSATAYPALALGLAAVIMLFYPITKDMSHRMQAELIARRQREASAAT
ncbi:MAG: MFS transporter [Verrucomicrobiota bacterium JB022]|nr:MFS transporter [Verrucomicrobiota bacterium JB022]